jgi:hypothetical protein
MTDAATDANSAKKKIHDVMRKSTMALLVVLTPSDY